MNKIQILLLSIILIQSACIGDSFCDESPDGYDDTNTIYFRLKDKDDGKELTEEVNRYDRDSISLTVDGIDVLEVNSFEENEYSKFSINNRQFDLTPYNDSLYLLYLDYQDVDTVQIQASRVIDQCKGDEVSLINTFVHNGDTLFDRILGIGDFIFIEIKK